VTIVRRDFKKRPKTTIRSQLRKAASRFVS